jgi:hypothetical protein
MIVTQLLPDFCLSGNETCISLGESLLAVHPGRQLFKVHTSQKNVLISRLGTRFTIPAFAIRSITGEIIHREVDLYLLENFSPAEMAASGRPATSNGQLIASRWQLDINASLDGIALQLHHPIGVELPISSPPRSSQLPGIYSGGKASIRTFGASDLFEWERNTHIPLFQSKKNNLHYLNFHLPEFNWYAIGNIRKKKQSIKLLTVYLQDELQAYDEVMSFLLYPALNSTAYLYKSRNGFKAINVPQKEKFLAVVVGRKGESLYLGMGSNRQSEGKTMKVRMLPTSAGEIVSAIHEKCAAM